MGKASAAKKQPESATNPRLGYRRAAQRVELAGNWQPEAGPLHGQLVGAFEFKQRSGRGRGKIRIMYAFKLLDPCVGRVKAEGGGHENAELAPGEFCGVIGSPGLRDLQGLYGCKVYMTRRPEKKELENGNAMWEFDIDYAGTPRKLPVRKYVAETEAAPDEQADPEDDSFNPDDFAF